MIELREVIQQLLKSVHQSVFFHSAPSKIQYPYIVYDMEIYDLGEDVWLVTMEVDGWDDDKDSESLETLLSNINDQLNKTSIVTKNFAMIVALERIMPLSDEKDKTINRRRYVYEGRLYKRV